MKRDVKNYNSLGHVQWPIHDSDYHDLAYIVPEKAGVMTVRLLVEDTTIDHSIPIKPGRNANDDFMVATDLQHDTATAHKYFSSSDIRIVDNILLAATDWCGIKRVSGTLNVVEYFRCEYKHLDPAAKKLYDRLKNEIGTQLWLVTSINTRKDSVNALMEEVDRMQLPLRTIPKTPLEPIFCRACEKLEVITVKPNLSARKLGWKRLAAKYWLCPKHNDLSKEKVDAMVPPSQVPQ